MAAFEMEDQVRVTAEDGMILAEMVHRTANEASAALAAIHLVRTAKGPQVRDHLLDQAAARLEGFAAINSALAVSFARPVDVGHLLDRVVQSIAAGRGSRAGQIILDLRSVYVEPAQARRILLMGYELVSNAVRHVIEVYGGRLEISLFSDGDILELGICDNGPGISATTGTSGTGLGNRLVVDLVRRAGGRLECATGDGGTAFRIFVPASVPIVSGIGEAH